MISSKKVFYLILISILIISSVFGINMRGTNTYITDSSIYLNPGSDGQVAMLSSPDEDNSEMVASLEMMPESDDSDSTSIIVDVNNDSQTTEEAYSHVGGSETISTESTETTTVSTESGESSGDTTVESSVTDDSGITEDTTTTQTTTTATTTTTTTTVRTTTTTTTTQPPTTTTTTTTAVSYYNTGSISFGLYAGGAAVEEYTIYQGQSVRFYLNNSYGGTPIAYYGVDNESIAPIISSEVGSVTIYAQELGTTWIHAYSTDGTCHCKITVTDFENQVIYLCNQYRVAAGLQPLQIGPPELKAVADLRLTELYSKFSHTRPDGSKFSTAYPLCGIQYGYFGENLAIGYTTPEDTVREWMLSEDHRKNIMNPDFVYCSVSVGVSYLNGLPHTYWSQQFYTPYTG